MPDVTAGYPHGLSTIVCWILGKPSTEMKELKYRKESNNTMGPHSINCDDPLSDCLQTLRPSVDPQLQGCVHTHTHTHTHTLKYTLTHTHTHTHSNTHTHTHTHTQIHTLTHTHTHSNTHTHTHTHSNTHTHTHSLKYTHIHTHSNTHAHSNTYTHLTHQHVSAQRGCSSGVLHTGTGPECCGHGCSSHARCVLCCTETNWAEPSW